MLRCGSSPGRVRSRFLVLLALGLASLLVCSLSVSGKRVPPGPRVVTLHHQQTIATLYLDGNGDLSRCQMLEVNFPDEERAALATISRERPITEVSFQHLFKAMLLCERLDPPATTSAPGVTSERDQRDAGWNSFSVFRGLVPGTKWCGLGDTATGWNDLGPNANLDRCCRTHDLCPVKVKAYKRKYGLFNWSIYTKSHCACDEAFLQCLKSTGMPAADNIGRLYFDVIQVQCVRPRLCAPHESPAACREKEKAAGPPGYRFSAPLRSYGGAALSKRGDGGVSSESRGRAMPSPPDVSGGSRDHPADSDNGRRHRGATSSEENKQRYRPGISGGSRGHPEEHKQPIIPEPNAPFISGGSKDHPESKKPAFIFAPKEVAGQPQTAVGRASPTRARAGRPEVSRTDKERGPGLIGIFPAFARGPARGGAT